MSSYSYFQAMRFAVEEINNSTSLLPGVLLGYEMMDICYLTNAAHPLLYFLANNCSMIEIGRNDTSYHPTVITIISPDSSPAAITVAYNPESLSDPTDHLQRNRGSPQQPPGVLRRFPHHPECRAADCSRAVVAAPLRVELVHRPGPPEPALPSRRPFQFMEGSPRLVAVPPSRRGSGARWAGSREARPSFLSWPPLKQPWARVSPAGCGSPLKLGLLTCPSTASATFPGWETYLGLAVQDVAVPGLDDFRVKGSLGNAHRTPDPIRAKKHASQSLWCIYSGTILSPSCCSSSPPPSASRPPWASLSPLPIAPTPRCVFSYVGVPTELRCLFCLARYSLCFTICLACAAIRSIRILCAFKMVAWLPATFISWSTSKGQRVFLATISAIKGGHRDTQPPLPLPEARPGCPNG
ncbi:Taste receptor type 1 member 2, partial [Ophiophagus hannah]